MRPLLLAVVLSAGCMPAIPTSPTAPPKPPELPDERLSCFTLHDHYALNEAAAKLAHADKWILVTGIGGQVSQTDTGYSFPLLEMQEVCVLCLFDKSQEQAVANYLMAGRRANVIGQVAEIRRGPLLYRNTLVVLRYCEVR